MTTEENTETPEATTDLAPDEIPVDAVAETGDPAASQAAATEPERQRAPGGQERPAGERPYGDRGAGGSGSRRRQQGKYRQRRRKVCTFCVEKVDRLDWKNIHKLRKFQTERGKIVSRRTSGTCARHQRQVTTAIHRARHMALLPYVSE